MRVLQCSNFVPLSGHHTQAYGSAEYICALMQVVRAIVPKIILDDVFTVCIQLMHSCMVNTGSAGSLP